MRFFKKIANTQIITDNLNYSNAGQRDSIRAILIKEQQGFCAYSERFIKHTDSVDIEHFDARKKNTIHDDYYNWYATLHWLNSHKPNLIEPYLPILIPYSEDLNNRIRYQDNLFVPVDENDSEAKNLIDFLGVNKHAVYTDRMKHVSRIRTFKSLCGDDNIFLNKMAQDQDNLSFATALEYNLQIDVDILIEEAINK